MKVRPSQFSNLFVVVFDGDTDFKYMTAEDIAFIDWLADIEAAELNRRIR